MLQRDKTLIQRINHHKSNIQLFFLTQLAFNPTLSGDESLKSLLTIQSTLAHLVHCLSYSRQRLKVEFDGMESQNVVFYFQETLQSIPRRAKGDKLSFTHEWNSWKKKYVEQFLFCEQFKFLSPLFPEVSEFSCRSDVFLHRGDRERLREWKVLESE